MRKPISLPIAAGFLVLCLATLGPASLAGEVGVETRATAQLARGESILSQRLLTGRLAALLRLTQAATQGPGEVTDPPGFTSHGIYDDPDPAGFSKDDRRQPPPKTDSTRTKERGKRRSAGTPQIEMGKDKKAEQR